MPTKRLREVIRELDETTSTLHEVVHEAEQKANENIRLQADLVRLQAVLEVYKETFEEIGEDELGDALEETTYAESSVCPACQGSGGGYERELQCPTCNGRG